MTGALAQLPAGSLGALGEDGDETTVAIDYREPDGGIVCTETATVTENPLLSQDFHRSNSRNCGKADASGRRCARFPPVKRTASALLSFWALILVAAPAALAENGVGLAGPTTDKTVTFFCFGVIFFFAALVIVMSLVQGRLEKRKDRRRADLKRLG